MKPVILAVGGSDSSGGAGIQIDLRTIGAWGAWPACVVTAVTAQNTRGVLAAAALDPDLVREQMDAVFDDLEVVAVKTGMLATPEIVEAVAAGIRERQPRFVVADPVLASGSGASLAAPGTEAAFRTALLPLVTVVTPNVAEAERLTGREIRSADDAAGAAAALRDLGGAAALVTGGHLPDAPGTDVLADGDGVEVYPPDWIEGGRVHGTGCVTASSLAAALALGDTLRGAVAAARSFVRDAIRAAETVGGGDRCLVPGSARPLPEPRS